MNRNLRTNAPKNLSTLLRLVYNPPMDFGVRQPSDRARSAAISHRCPQCREQALVLQRRHVSPARLGEALVTEFYECDSCDAGYQYSPADNRWKPLSS